MRNPFSFGKPVDDAERFINREQEIHQVLSRILSSAHESTSIVGERRMGKTSLLKYISNPKVAPILGLHPNEYCLVYIDFQGLTDIKPLRFWQRLLEKLVRSLTNEKVHERIKSLLTQSEIDLFDLEDLFDLIQKEGLCVVFLFDEFENITQNENFSPDFFGGLRSLAIHHDIALVTATSCHLEDLCHSEEIKSSPFFNIFATVCLRPFSQETISKMLDVYMEPTGLQFTIPEKDFLFHLGGGHPFFLQIAGYYYLDNMKSGLASTRLLGKTIEDFELQAKPHYEYLWLRCSDSEKITLLTLLGLRKQKITSRTQPNIENLSRIYARSPMDIISLSARGIIVERETAFSITPPSFENWIIAEILVEPGNEVPEITVDEWLKSGGMEHLKPIKNSLPKFKRKYWHIIGEVLKEISYEMITASLFGIIKGSL